MTIESGRFGRVILPIFILGLIGYPLCILFYWWLNPAYGQFDSPAILGAITGNTKNMVVANAFGLAACLFAIPGTIAAMVAIGDCLPRLVLIGGSMVIVGWVAVFGILILDVVAVQIVATGPASMELIDLFERIGSSSTLLALNGLASLHLIGGLVLGIAFWRSRLVPSWAAVILIVSGPIHFASNIAGILIIDSLTWIALIAANIAIIKLLQSKLNKKNINKAV